MRPISGEMDKDAMADKPSLTYADAGVDVAAGDALVKTIAPDAASTRRAGADADLGGFGGLFDLKAAGYADPVLVSGTDGVGTKLDIAAAMGSHHEVGVDLVAMCVNDILAQGAEPLFFLDYFATSALSGAPTAAFVAGVAEGCRDAGCALIGGETAEMPGLYGPGRYDAAGFCVGAVERGGVLPKMDAMGAGDVLIAVASSGAHSNGFSLIRRIVDQVGLTYEAPAPWDGGQALGAALLTPTRIYVASILPLLRSGCVKGCAHITGGGVTGNVPRMLPEHLEARVDWTSWRPPAVFDWLAEAGPVAWADMRATFNCGVGFVLCAAKDAADGVIADLTAAGETAWVCGDLVDRA